MLKAPYVMRLAQDLARHASARQTQIAKNIANADTPGYRSRDVVDFAETFNDSRPAEPMRASRAGHMSAGPSAAVFRTFDAGGEAAPNGNTVSIEDEMVRATQAKSDHDLSLTIYKTSLDIIRTSLGRGR